MATKGCGACDRKHSRGHEPFCTPETRFWGKVRIGPGCWEWQAATAGQTRYGVISDGTRMVYAHRFAYERTVEPVPADLVVMHICDNPRCVRVSHLTVGTVKDNVHDMLRKGRHKPPRHPRRTHCVHGHAYTPENTIVRRKRGQLKRECRTCVNARSMLASREYRAKRRGEAA
jgi:hypothetical protein